MGFYGKSMDGYAVNLEKFEGPLDLLIHLISVNKIDIYDIPIAEITHQYLDYIHTWQEFDMEIASEFVVMASKLLEIKSRMLLPRSEEEVPEEDARNSLVRQLLEYRIYKSISEEIGAREEAERGAVYKDPEYIRDLPKADTVIEISTLELASAFARVFSGYSDAVTFREYSGEIVREVYTVEEKIQFIDNQFAENHCHELKFSRLFADRVERPEVVVTFMAILELYKTGRIAMSQNRLFQEIMLWRTEPDDIQQ